MGDAAECRRLLVVEDDPAIAELLAERFGAYDEFAVTFVATACKALRLVDDPEPDLILLDVRLPDQDGRETCKIMRRRGVRAPIIMLTCADADADVVLGLDAGADDYVSKPFRFIVLLARMRAQMRKIGYRDATAVLRFGSYELHAGSRLLQGPDRKRIRLTDKETDIIRILYHADGRSVAREILLHEIWGYTSSVSTHTLETHVYRLRRKIETDPSKAALLVTKDGGYALTRGATV